MITHLIAAGVLEADVPVTPTNPLIAKLRRRYSAFAQVSADDISYWLDDATRIVTPAWGEDEEVGLISLAAHNMILAGTVGITKTAAEQLPAGVTRFRSASMDVAVSETVANRTVSGGYSSTLPGQEFAILLRRHVGGPRLVGIPSYPIGWC